VYREWIKTYNGGIKKIRKIMKTEEEYLKKGRILGKIRSGEKKVDPGKNYEEYLKGRRIGEKKKNC
jgi:hypothetical protein